MNNITLFLTPVEIYFYFTKYKFFFSDITTMKHISKLKVIQIISSLVTRTNIES